MPDDRIVGYYDHCEADYRLFWDLNHSHAMHAGFWDETTRTLRQALKRENEVLAELAGIKEGEHVLDAGCGVGGSSIFLAKTCRCHVLGITLSAKQVHTATRNAIQEGVQENAVFQLRDYTSTGLPSHSYDVVWAIESICHAKEKRLFIKEAMRLLKPGGRLILADGFAAENQGNPDDRLRMKIWLEGWGVESLDQAATFKSGLEEEGFVNIQFHDITKHVIPSSQRLYWLSWPAIPLSKAGEWLGLRHPSQTANLLSAKCQYLTLKKGLWVYGIFYASAPEKNYTG